MSAQDSSASASLSAAAASTPDRCLWFLFREQKLLIRNGVDSPAILQDADIQPFRPQLGEPLDIGLLRGLPCRAAMVDLDPAGDSFSFVDLRSLFDSFDEEQFLMAGRALQLVNWSRNNRFCGRCGTRTQPLENERAMRCPACGLTSFPRISPAIIVAIVREGRLLLARHARTRNDMRTVLAGYLEPGESLESCVEREVREEVGIRIKNIRYFASQPWPFPDALMIAFTAEHAEGEIAVDGVEIVEAGWYSPGNLPKVLPRGHSVSGRLIGWFVERFGGPHPRR